MTGAEFRTYVIQVFKRTSHDAELYQSITDTIREMSRRFGFDEARVESDVTDTLGALGDFKLDLEDDFGTLIGNVLLRDGTRSIPLEKLTKEEFDSRYPDPEGLGVVRGRPVSFCIFSRQVLIGPVPDTVDYEFHYSYIVDDGTVAVAGTANVKFSQTHPELLRHGVLARLFGDVLKMQDLGSWHEAKFEMMMVTAESAERRNTSSPQPNRYHGV